jgi:hypothetical protein
MTETDKLMKEFLDGSPESKAIFKLAGVDEYETFVKLILPEAVRKWNAESCEFLVYANNRTECPLCWEMLDAPWLDAACALGYPVPEEDEDDSQ